MMLCPSCGGEMLLGVIECRCGARFVGEPLGPPLVKVQRYGPTVTSVLLLVLVTAAALLFTKFLAFGAVLVIWSARRAMRLARRDPEGYGGFRTSAATLAVTLVGSVVSGGFAIASIPKFLENRRIRQTAASQAEMYHTAKLLEDYKRRYGSYPPDELAWRQVMPEALPKDYWKNQIKYQGYTQYVAEATKDPKKRAAITINNFELRSAGPDEKLGTDDDIVMIDGIFYTNAEAKKRSGATVTTLR